MGNNTSETVQVNLKLNGLQDFKTFKDLNGAVVAQRNALNKMKLDDPGYNEAAKRLRSLVDQQAAWRKEIHGGKEAQKSFFSSFKEGFSEISRIGSGVAIGSLVAGGLQNAIGWVKNFVGESKEAYREAELGQAQMEAVLTSTGGAAGKTKDDLNALSQSLMHLTGVDDDVITKSENLLLTFTNIRGGIYDDALPAIVDMTAAMNGGNVSMENIQTTSIQVGKALNDPITGMTALRKVGVAFSEDQKTVIRNLVKTNDVAGAQRIILNELQKEFGGVAEKMSSTEAGAAQRFQTRLGNIQESIGGLVTRLQNFAMKGFNPLMGWAESILSTKTEAEELTSAFDAQALTVSRLEKNTSPLLARYDELAKKGSLNKIEQKELKTVIAQIAEAIPSAVTEFDKYGVALGINTKIGKEFIDTQRAMLSYMNKDSIEANERVLKSLEAQQFMAQKVLNQKKQIRFDSRGELIEDRAMTNEEIEIARKKLTDITFMVEGARATIKRLKGDDIPAPTKTEDPFTIGGDAEEQRKKAAAARKAQLDAQKQKQDEIKREHTQFLADLQKNEEAVFLTRLSKNDAEVETVRLKYEKLRERAKGNKDELTQIAIDEADEFTHILSKQAKEEIKIQQEISEKTKEEFLKRNHAKAEIQQQIYELGLSDREKEQAQLDKMYEEMVVDAESFGLDSTKIYSAWTDAKIKLDEKHAENHKATEEEKKNFAIDMAQLASDSIFGIMSSNRQAESQANIEAINKKREQELANSELSESQKKAINEKYDKQVAAEKLKAWKAEQRASVAQAVINGALAVTKATAQTGVLAPFVIPSIIAGTLAQVAVILAQKAPQFKKGGMIPAGPSHSEGGINLVNNKTGQTIGEIEGGEPVIVLSKETQRNNSQIINELLFNSQYRNGAPVTVNTAAAISGLGQYRTGGVLSAQDISVNAQPDLSALLYELRSLKGVMREEQTRNVSFNYRLFEDFATRVDKIRTDVNG